MTVTSKHCVSGIFLVRLDTLRGQS